MATVLVGWDGDKGLINPFADDTMPIPDLMAFIAESKRQELELREVTKNAVTDDDLAGWKERPKANTKLVVGDARRVARKMFDDSDEQEYDLVGTVLFPAQDLTWRPGQPICVPVQRTITTGMDKKAQKQVYKQTDSHNYRQFKTFQVFYRMWDERLKIEKDMQAGTKEDLNAALHVVPKIMQSSPVFSKVPEFLRRHCLLINLPKGATAPTMAANRPDVYKGEDSTDESSMLYINMALADLEVVTEICELMTNYAGKSEVKIYHSGDPIKVKIPEKCVAMIPEDGSVVCTIDYTYSATVSPHINVVNGAVAYGLDQMSEKMKKWSQGKRVEEMEYGSIVNNGVHVMQPTLPGSLILLNRLKQRNYSRSFAADPSRKYGTPISIPVVHSRLNLLMPSELIAQKELLAVQSLELRAAKRQEIHPAAFRLGPFSGNDDTKTDEPLEKETKKKLDKEICLKWYLSGVQTHNGPLFFEDQEHDPGFMQLNTNIDFVFLAGFFRNEVFKAAGLGARDLKFANMQAPLLETSTGIMEAEIIARSQQSGSPSDTWKQQQWDRAERLAHDLLNSKESAQTDEQIWRDLKKALKEKHQLPDESHQHSKELSAYFKKFPLLMRVPKTDSLVKQFKNFITKMWSNVSFVDLVVPLADVRIFKTNFLNYLKDFAWPVSFELLKELEAQLKRLSAAVTPGDSALADEIELLNTKLNNKGGMTKGLTAESHVYFAVGQDFLAPSDEPDKPVWEVMSDANKPKAPFLLYAVPRESLDAPENNPATREELLSAYNALKVWKSPDEQLLIMDTDEGDKMEVDEEPSKKRKAVSNSAADDETAPNPKKQKVTEIVEPEVGQTEPANNLSVPAIPDFTDVTF